MNEHTTTKPRPDTPKLIVTEYDAQLEAIIKQWPLLTEDERHELAQQITRLTLPRQCE